MLKKHFATGGATQGDADIVANLIEALSVYEIMGAEIEDYWRAAENRRVLSWLEHRHINMVMLAARLVPGGILKK